MDSGKTLQEVERQNARRIPSRLLARLLLLAIVAAGVIEWSTLAAQEKPATPQRSNSTTNSNSADEASTFPAKNSKSESQLSVTPANAIPEEQSPVLLDGPTSPSASASGVDDPAAVGELADLIGGGKFPEVEPRLVEYLKAWPRSSQAHYFYGYILFRQLRVGDSIRELAKALELNTENGEAHKILGRALSVLGRYDLALTELNEAGRLMPHSAEVFYNRGRIYSIQDDFHKARTEFEAALRLNPDYMEAYNALGFAMEALGDDPAALKSYEKAVQLSEQQGAKFEAPYVNLSGYYGRRGEFQTSLDYARKALALNPNSDLAYYQLAKTYRTQEDWPNMADALEKAIALKPTSAQYYYVLSSAYRKLGKHKESELALEQFRKIDKQTAEMEAQRRVVRRETSPPEPKKPE
jgi:tetratricopeptide (TPR) repeat protein